MRAKTAPFRVSIIVLILALAVFTTACERDAHAGGAPAGVARSIASSTADAYCDCALDVSDSLDPAQFTATKEQSKASLPDFMSTWGCDNGVRLFAFADEGGFAQSTELSVATAPAAKVTDEKLDDSIAYTRAAAELHRRQQERAQAEALERARAARAGLLRDARNWIDAHTAPLHPTCTALRSLVTALNDRVVPARATAIYTDGATGPNHECDPSPQPLPVRHPVVFIVIPQRGDPQVTMSATRDTARWLERAYPGSIAVPSFELNDSGIWPALKTRVAAGGAR